MIPLGGKLPDAPGRYLGWLGGAWYIVEFGYEPEESDSPGAPFWGDETGEDLSDDVTAWLPLPPDMPVRP